MTQPTLRRLRGMLITSSGPCKGTLVDMSRSGVIQVRATGREKHYWLKQDSWKQLLNRGESIGTEMGHLAAPVQCTGANLVAAAGREIAGLESLLQASEVRQLMMKVRPSLERAGFDRELSDDRQHLGESYLPVFIEDVRKLLA